MSEAPLTASRLLTADDLAARWSVDRSFIYKLVKRGDLAAVKLGRVVRFSLEAVDDFEARKGTDGRD
jgi:excisionase family DNA binding protein